MDEKIEYNPAWGICKPIRNNDEYEIAKIICKTTHKTELKHCEIVCNVDCINYGKAIKEAGYRKESDTAREIISKLKELSQEKMEQTLFDVYKFYTIGSGALDELAKEYGVKL
jgi:hypothetical protein